MLTGNSPSTTFMIDTIRQVQNPSNLELRDILRWADDGGSEPDSSEFKDAVLRLYSRYLLIFTAVNSKLCIPFQEHEDLIMGFLCRMLCERKIPHYRERDGKRFRCWIATAYRNYLNDMLRSNWNRQTRERKRGSFGDRQERDPLERCIEEEEKNLFEAAKKQVRARFPDKYWVFHLNLKGQTQLRIAEHLDVDRKTIERWIQDVKGALRRAVGNRID